MNFVVLVVLCVFLFAGGLDEATEFVREMEAMFENEFNDVFCVKFGFVLNEDLVCVVCDLFCLENGFEGLMYES